MTPSVGEKEPTLMTPASRTAPCLGFPARLRYPDIDPDELAREEARERGGADPWPAFFERIPAPPATGAGGRHGPAAG